MVNYAAGYQTGAVAAISGWASTGRMLDPSNGSAIQLFSNNYATATYGLGVNGYGLSYNGGNRGYIDAYAIGGWKDGGGWACSPT